MSGVAVRPVRFTDRIEAMQEFLETLGLRPRIEAERGGWVDMVAYGGMVALHSAETAVSGAVAGQTCLSFEAADVVGLADRLRKAGVPDVTVYDEAYGQVLNCRDPLGDVIAVDGRSDDLYGYRRHDAAAAATDLRVVPVRFTEPTGPYGGWLEAMGLTLVGEPNDFYVQYAAADGDHGFVGVHHVYDDELPIVAGRAAAHLTFATSEPLEAIAERLAAAGHGDASVDREDFGCLLTVTDPDDQEVQVHELPAGAAVS